ncbi:MAG TPA: hypothetical protein VL500_00840 [Candidatus Eisenbacteria bacterium]|jgi:hypothetical protein|nr:hypothetical protein [Candidatus Eisenbacteria bacterium]
MSAKKHPLTQEARDRIARFIELSKKRGISVELNSDESKVTLKNRKGEILASRPVSDFSDG